ncbi:MAG TPA: gluconate 2-dehydrogenase subunit 3 family protein, partial [Candidatus Eremiobacteraceae bacterium]|nr:gluconate 2-dehydrogenase subunit 3 family protein [Candidatus Eremiobacteraceae bacterium]
MQLTPRQKQALESICETFLPKAEDWPSAVEMGVPEALADALEFNPRTRDHAQFLNLLDIWNSKLHAFLTV